MACSLILELGSCSRFVTVTFRYAYRSCVLGVDCNGRILAVSVTVLVPILSGSDPDRFTLVRGGISDLQYQTRIFLTTLSLTPFSY